MERLAALVPLARFHTVRYFGAFAPHANARKKVIQRTRAAKKSNKIHLDWARLLARTFQHYIQKCPACGKRMRITGAVTALWKIEAILNILDIGTHPPPLAPPRISTLF